jgi:hypothetical protein
VETSGDSGERSEAAQRLPGEDLLKWKLTLRTEVLESNARHRAVPKRGGVFSAKIVFSSSQNLQPHEKSKYFQKIEGRALHKSVSAEVVKARGQSIQQQPKKPVLW